MKLGKIQDLVIRRFTGVGAFLNETASGGEDPDVLLPKKYVPEELNVGDSVSVFVMRDSEDRLLATTRTPKATVGDFALLSVAQTTKIGAFLDWGMEKDLFLPFEEQTRRVKSGDRVFVFVYVDKSGRIASTMRVKSFFEKPVSLRENDRVTGIVYSVHPEIGAFVLVDGKYNALLPKQEQLRAFQVGEEIQARVQAIKPDGKIDLSLQSRMHEVLDRDAATIRTMLEQNGGFLRVNDHTRPEDIRLLFGMSKAQFKRALGRLLKQRVVCFDHEGIRKVERKKRR